MKVIIAGSRNFNNYDFLQNKINKLKLNITEIVCGEAKGADLLGKQYGINNNIPVKSFPAEWDKYGKSAGYIRNKEMAEYADYLIAFWDGESKGTNHMINIMRNLNKHGSIFIYKEEN